MQRHAIFALALVALACGGAPKPITPPGPPPAPPTYGEDGAAAPDAAGAAVGCADKDECNTQGVAAILGGDAATAAPLLQRACDLGNAAGCFNLAAVYSDGQVIEKDAARSAALYAKACDLGDARGCLGAGMTAYEGAGVDKDPQAALRLFERSCELGEAEACKNVGVLLWGGTDVAEDRDAAITYFRKACAGGYQESCDVIKEIEAQLAGGGAEGAGGGGIAGANLTVGSMSVNDMTVNDLECRLDGMGLMAAMQLVASIAAQKKAMDKCAPKGDAPRVKWVFSGGTARQVEVSGVTDTKLEKCVAKAAGKMESTIDGECAAYFLIGAAAGATAAYEKAKAGP